MCCYNIRINFFCLSLLEKTYELDAWFRAHMPIRR